MPRYGLAICLTIAGLLAQPALAADSFPVSVKNCGAVVVLNAAPKRIFLVNSDDIALLASLDALDLVVARTAALPLNVYDAAIEDLVAKVPLIASEANATGGSVISFETILAAQPDLVLAPEAAVDRQLLADAGIALYSPPAYCNDKATMPNGTASFDLVFDQVAMFGKLLGRSEQAAVQIAALGQHVKDLSENRTADFATGMALYVGAGGKALYPYGARSMVTPIFEAAGLHNVYAGTDERVFEASIEELLGKDPDVIVLLYSDGTPDAVVAAFNSAPGVENLAAVKAGRIVPLAFSFTDPPTPNSVIGAKILAEKLSALE